MKIKIPKIYKPLWKKESRFYFLRGGRGSGKSWAVADYLLVQLIVNPNLSLICLREVQLSINKSSKKLLEDRIKSLGLGGYFEILHNEIRCCDGDGVIIFKGLQTHTVDSIKSLEGFTFCWVEEAQTISEYSLELLIPTLRAEDNKLFFTYNPKSKSDPVEELRRLHSNIEPKHFDVFKQLYELKPAKSI